MTGSSSPTSNSPLPNRPAPADPQQIAQRFAGRLEELRSALHGIDPYHLAERSGINYDPQSDGKGSLHLSFWGRPLSVSFPGLIVYRQASGEPANPFEQAMILYYLSMADGTPPSGQWIAFSDLPDGRFYNQAFQGYTGREIARAFQNDLPAFAGVALRLGGEAHSLGDAAYAFYPLPRLPLLAVYWQGDEDFPASSQILFDACASHYFPTEGCAILGSSLARKLIAAR